MSRYLYKKIQNISPESLNFQHSGLKLTTLGRVDAPLAVVRPSQNPDLRLSRIRLFAKRIVHIYQLYTLTYIRGLTSG